MNWNHIDNQMKAFSDRLVKEVKLTDDMAKKLATTVAADVRSLTTQEKSEICDSSPVPLKARLDELLSFQGWMEQTNANIGNPFVSRAQVITQNYICFVYLPESCFRVLAKVSPTGSAAKKCAKFLTNNPVRAFRNAIAHSNWTYREDFAAIVYWARKGNEANEPLERFEVTQEDLSFWQSVSRCVAYAAFSSL